MVLSMKQSRTDSSQRQGITESNLESFKSRRNETKLLFVNPDLTWNWIDDISIQLNDIQLATNE